MTDANNLCNGWREDSLRVYLYFVTPSGDCGVRNLSSICTRAREIPRFARNDGLGVELKAGTSGLTENRKNDLGFSRESSSWSAALHKVCRTPQDLDFEDYRQNQRAFGGLFADVALEVHANFFLDNRPVGTFFGVRSIDGP